LRFEYAKEPVRKSSRFFASRHLKNAAEDAGAAVGCSSAFCFVVVVLL